jgi:hypothetical protein
VNITLVVKGSAVRTGDVVDHSGRLVTQVEKLAHETVLHHGPVNRTIVDPGSIVRVRRVSRVEDHDEAARRPALVHTSESKRRGKPAA